MVYHDHNWIISVWWSVRNRVGLKGATRPYWALEVSRRKQGETRYIQMSSNWGAPRGNLRFIYRTLYKQGTNVEKDTEELHKRSMEWSCNGKMVVQNWSQGNDKGLTNLQHDWSSYQKWQLQHEGGKSVRKSIETCEKGLEEVLGMGIKLGVFRQWMYLNCWHIPHSLIWFQIKLHIPGQ